MFKKFYNATGTVCYISDWSEVKSDIEVKNWSKISGILVFILDIESEDKIFFGLYFGKTSLVL